MNKKKRREFKSFLTAKQYSKIDEGCHNIEANVAKVKRSAQQFAESMIAVIKAKKQQIFTEADHEALQSLQRLRVQRVDIENKVKNIETAVGKSETLLKRSTNAELTEIDNTLSTIIPKEVDDEREVDRDLEGLHQFIFEENESLKKKTNDEGIGFIKTFLNVTRGYQSIAEGKGLAEAIVGIQANFVLITRNVEGQQCYEKRDRVTAKIKNHQRHDCATEVRVQDKKDGSYKISYFVKESGRCEVVVKVNEEQVQGSPFPVQVKPRQFRPVLSFGQYGSSAGILKLPGGVTVNEHDEITVTDTGDRTVQVFSGDGTYLRSFGRKGNKQGEFDYPSGITIHETNNIIIADTGNNLMKQAVDYMS